MSTRSLLHILNEVFKHFTDLPQIFITTRISSLIDFTIEIDATNPSDSREIFVTATFRNDATMMEKFFDLANQAVQGISDTKNLTFSLSFQPLPQLAKGGNSLGLGPEDGDIVNVLVTVPRAEQADDMRIEEAAKSLFSRAEAASKAMGTYNPYLLSKLRRVLPKSDRWVRKCESGEARSGEHEVRFRSIVSKAGSWGLQASAELARLTEDYE